MYKILYLPTGKYVQFLEFANDPDAPKLLSNPEKLDFFIETIKKGGSLKIIEAKFKYKYEAVNALTDLLNTYTFLKFKNPLDKKHFEIIKIQEQ